jgi:hypothetical protein
MMSGYRVQILLMMVMTSTEDMMSVVVSSHPS